MLCETFKRQEMCEVREHTARKENFYVHDLLRNMTSLSLRVNKYEQTKDKESRMATQTCFYVIRVS